MKTLNTLLVFLSIYFSAFSQSPTIISFSPDSGAVGTLVTVKGTNLSNPTAFTIGGVSAIVISGSNDSIVGMVMPGTISSAVSVTTSGGTAISSRNFTISHILYPHTQQGSKLIGTGAVGQAIQGTSVAISADGNTAIVGGAEDSSRTGAVWIYTRAGTNWSQQGTKLIGTGAIGASEQGGAVALSADGNTAIVGGGEDSTDTRGAAWIFTRSGGVWSQQGPKLVGSGVVGLFCHQGWGVSISADGNTAIVGGCGDNNFTGAVWIYTRTGSTWSQQDSKLVGTGGVGQSNQGWSVALSADGNTAIVGGHFDNNNIGAAWIFTRTGSIWSQQGSKLVANDAVGQSFQGISVSISADGNTAMVGGDMDSSRSGAAWIYTRNGSTWNQQGNKLVGTGATGPSYQGRSVSLSADGNTAVVGALGDNSNMGASWVYTRSNNNWMQQGNKLQGTGVIGLAYQGIAVALSADGSTAIMGGEMDNNYIGAAWIFVNDTVSVCYSNASNTKQSICQGNSYSFGSQILTKTGIYYDTLINAGGCDSIVSINLSVTPVATRHISDTIRNGGAVTLGIHTYHEPGTYIDTIISAGGCDSIIILQLYVITGIEEINSSSYIHLYPNPNKGSFTLQTSGSINSEYVISDMLGHVVARELIRSDKQSIEMPDAAEGVYMLSVAGAAPVRFVVLR